MVKDEIISIIIPAYNAESVLERCVRSVLEQTDPSFEIIIVNDGSKDRTRDIAQNLANEDQRIQVIHKKNGGVSAARNDALNVVKGEWIMFVDADDYLSPDFLASLREGAYCDLIVGSYLTEGAHDIPSVRYDSYKATTAHEIRELLEQHLTDMTFLCPWGKLFKTSLVQSLHLTFNTQMRVGEDVVFVWHYLAHCSSVALISTQGYHYFTSQGSDFKYALDQQTAILTIQSILKELNQLKVSYGMDIEKAHRHILNYYIWLFKLYIKKNYSLKDLNHINYFFYHPLIFQYFKDYKYNSKDKYLVYILLRLHLTPFIYLLVKLYYR